MRAKCIVLFVAFLASLSVVGCVAEAPTDGSEVHSAFDTPHTNRVDPPAKLSGVAAQPEVVDTENNAGVDVPLDVDHVSPASSHSEWDIEPLNSGVSLVAGRTETVTFEVDRMTAGIGDIQVVVDTPPEITADPTSLVVPAGKSTFDVTFQTPFDASPAPTKIVELHASNTVQTDVHTVDVSLEPKMAGELVTGPNGQTSIDYRFDADANADSLARARIDSVATGASQSDKLFVSWSYVDSQHYDRRVTHIAQLDGPHWASNWGEGGHLLLRDYAQGRLPTGAKALEIDSRGRVYALADGTFDDRTYIDGEVMVRLNPDGTFDTGFGQDGVAALEHPDAIDNQFRSLVESPSAGVVTAGFGSIDTSCCNHTGVVLHGMHDDGSTDWAFGGASDGYFYEPRFEGTPIPPAEAHDLITTPTGEMVGLIRLPGEEHARLQRFSGSGTSIAWSPQSGRPEPLIGTSAPDLHELQTTSKGFVAAGETTLHFFDYDGESASWWTGAPSLDVQEQIDDFEVDDGAVFVSSPANAPPSERSLRRFTPGHAAADFEIPLVPDFQWRDDWSFQQVRILKTDANFVWLAGLVARPNQRDAMDARLVVWRVWNH